MYCPICRAEYREGFFKCADCKVPLVEGLPQEEPEPIPEYVDLQEVMATFDSGEIEMAKSLLDVNNISCVVDGQNFAGFGNMPARILVPKDEVTRANNILKKHL
jgi:hypothetical protein